MNAIATRTQQLQSAGITALSLATVLFMTAAPVSAAPSLSKEATKQDSLVEMLNEQPTIIAKAESDSDSELKLFFGRKYRHHRYGHHHRHHH